MKILVIIAIYIVVSDCNIGLAGPVDGYRSSNWGEPSENVIEAKYCDYVRYGEKFTRIAGLTVLACDDLYFGKTIRDALFIFHDDKFVRVSIAIKSEDIVSLAKSLRKRYKISKGEEPKLRYMIKLGEPVEGIWGWSKNTVLLDIAKSEDGKEMAGTLIFTSLDFDDIILQDFSLPD